MRDAPAGDDRAAAAARARSRTCGARGRATSPARSLELIAAPLWLHFDVDVLDQDVFPATDYLMPGGLDWDELGAALGPLLASPQLIGASLGCYNPGKDPDRACGRALVGALSRRL